MRFSRHAMVGFLALMTGACGVNPRATRVRVLHSASSELPSPEMVVGSDGVVYVTRPLNAATLASIPDEELGNAARSLIAIDASGATTALGIADGHELVLPWPGSLELGEQDRVFGADWAMLVGRRILLSFPDDSGTADATVERWVHVARLNRSLEGHFSIAIEENSPATESTDETVTERERTVELSGVTVLDAEGIDTIASLATLRAHTIQRARTLLGSMILNASPHARALGYLHRVPPPLLSATGAVERGAAAYRAILHLRNTMHNAWNKQTRVYPLQSSGPTCDVAKQGPECTKRRMLQGAEPGAVTPNADIPPGEGVALELASETPLTATALVRDGSHSFTLVCGSAPMLAFVKWQNAAGDDLASGIACKNETLTCLEVRGIADGQGPPLASVKTEMETHYDALRVRSQATEVPPAFFSQASRRWTAVVEVDAPTAGTSLRVAIPSFGTLQSTRLPPGALAASVCDTRDTTIVELKLASGKQTFEFESSRREAEIGETMTANMLRQRLEPQLVGNAPKLARVRNAEDLLGRLQVLSPVLGTELQDCDPEDSNDPGACRAQHRKYTEQQPRIAAALRVYHAKRRAIVAELNKLLAPWATQSAP